MTLLRHAADKPADKPGDKTIVEDKPDKPGDKPGDKPSDKPGDVKPGDKPDDKDIVQPLAGTNTTASPVQVYQVLNATHALPYILRLPEKASITVNAGTPVVVSSGYLIERTAISTNTSVIAGITMEAGHNLSADGAAPVGGSGLSYGSVPNQPSAKNIPIGAPMADGNLGIYVACDETIFVASTDTAHTLAATDLMSTWGFTKDSTTKNWFVDSTITTQATGGCCEIIGLVDPIGTAGGRVAFKFVKAFQQLFA